MTELLGIFPALDPVGGVQASGRDAWQGIVHQIGEDRAFFLGYRAGQSKALTALSALLRRRRATTLLVWHLRLLRLALLAANKAARVVVFLHGIEAWRPQDSLTLRALAKVDLFLSNSDHTWERFLSFNPFFRGAPHATVHLGSGDPSVGPLPAPAGPPAALMLGRMLTAEDYKGHRQLIDAWPRILQNLPQAELWIAGGGDLSASLERRAAGLPAIRFFGEITDRQKLNLLAQCRCLALPSSGEGFGLVYVEAMRLGRPCLVGDRDAGREVVNPPEAGLSAAPDDPLQLTAAVTRLLTAGAEWDAWSLRACARYESQFTAQHFRTRLNQALFPSGPDARA